MPEQESGVHKPFFTKNRSKNPRKFFLSSADSGTQRQVVLQKRLQEVKENYEDCPPTKQRFEGSQLFQNQMLNDSLGSSAGRTSNLHAPRRVLLLRTLKPDQNASLPALYEPLEPHSGPHKKCQSAASRALRNQYHYKTFNS